MESEERTVPTVTEWLENYRPQKIRTEDWVQGGLRAFVVEQIRRLDPPGVAQAKVDARTLARLGKWCLDQGMPLDVEHVLDPDTVERYATIALNGDPYAGDYRARLRRLGRTLTTTAPWEPPTAALRTRNVAVPYTARELDRLERDSLRQANAARTQTFRGILALGLGAGIDGRWSGHIRGSDVSRRGGITFVSVTNVAPRAVPVLAAWEDELQRLAEAAGEGLVIGGPASASKNIANRRNAGLVLGKGSPRLAAARLRSNWIVHHLTRGTRLPELAQAAGLTGITTFSDLLPFVPDMPTEDVPAMLRGA